MRKLRKIFNKILKSSPPYLRIFLASFFLSFQVFAASNTLGVKGQSQSTLWEAGRVQVPNSQATLVGDKNVLIENGNSNLLANPSFEHATVATGWTTAGTAVAETTDIVEGSGKKSLKITLAAYTGDILVQSITPVGEIGGLQVRASIFAKTSQSNISTCLRINSVDVECLSVTSDGSWHNYTIDNTGTSSVDHAIIVKSTSAVTGDIYFDNSSLGISYVDSPGTVVAQYVGTTNINTLSSYSSSHLATTSEETIVFTADSTLTLPAASGLTGKIYYVFNSGSTTETVIDPNSSETVCGQDTITLAGDGDSIAIQSNGTNWIGLNGGCMVTRSTYIEYSAGVPSATNQNPNGWVSSVTDVNTGRFIIVPKSNIFSGLPDCSAIVRNSSVLGTASDSGQTWSNNSLPFLVGSPTDVNTKVVCHGRR